MPAYKLLPEQTRQGDFESPMLLMPAGVKRVSMKAIIPDVDYESAANSIRFDLWQSLDGGVKWQHRYFFTWRGSGAKTAKAGDPNPPPGIKFNVEPSDIGTYFKVTVSIPSAMRIGAEIVTS